MCGSQQPLEGADSAPRPLVTLAPGVGAIFGPDEPEQVQCGVWVERSETEQGFCSLPPDHEGRCQPYWRS